MGSENVSQKSIYFSIVRFVLNIDVLFNYLKFFYNLQFIMYLFDYLY